MVSVTDALGCIIGEETFTVTFGVLASPAASVPSPPCEGEEVIVSASGSSGNYLWFTSATGGSSLGSGSSLVLPNVQSTPLYIYRHIQLAWIPVGVKEYQPIEVIAENIELVEMDTVVCQEPQCCCPGEIVQPVTTDSFQYTAAECGDRFDSLLMTVIVHLLDLQSSVLPAQLTLHLGDSIRLEPVFNFQADSLIWVPPGGLSCGIVRTHGRDLCITLIICCPFGPRKVV